MTKENELQLLMELESMARLTMDLSKLSTETLEKLIKYLQENENCPLSEELNKLVAEEQGWYN